ncbi:nonmuscle myosin heavy chain b [Russula vinacea]|nr:nonmuscle myosin heavy chain b [Russula vinacea]
MYASSISTSRISQGTEAARAAALQAEFNEKKWVWVPDEKDGYLAGWVAKEEDDLGEVVMAAGGDIRRLPLYALSKMNPPKFDRVEDIADLTFLNEASVVHNLRLRYGSGAIYTFSGLFLVAINPYQNLPLYSDSIIQQFRSHRRDENPPHIFAIAERAWVNMGEERENQSILITGESGAGKTESTKKVIQYLAAIATDMHHHPTTPSHSHSQSLSSSSSFGAVMPSTGLPGRTSILRHNLISAQSSPLGRLGLLERQILQANPILEAFGNAQTQRNNNSSRFGKFVRISFAPDGSIAGANIDWYLLEKSRVIVRAAAERSFHVFYQMLEGGGSLKDTLLLDGNASNYEYLNKSRREVDGIDDLEEWSLLKASQNLNALEVVGFSASEQFDLFRIVAAVLHIGNITITATRADDAVMPDPSQAERACHILGIPVAEFTRAVLRPRVLAGREWVTQARTRQQALDELGALSKTLYEKSFGALVDRINRALDRPTSKSTFIGVLDIAGFEIFEVNAYEQLLINYTNEKLQQFFNHHMFVLEQEEYAREGIEWDYVNFGLDLQPTIDLIEGSGSAIGVLSLLDEECIMPRATDLTFTDKLHQIWSGDVPDEEFHPGRHKYEPSRFDQGFIVHHYAGKVEYHTDGWLEKNKDPMNDNLIRVLATSSEPYVASLFSEFAGAPSSFATASNTFSVGKKRTMKKGAFRTVGQRHKEQLQSLMAQLYATQPHFVRCIVPNASKKPGRVDVPLVLDQLRCNGVLEGIRIARLGYPNRLPFIEFRQRYEILTPGIIPRGYMDGRKACLRMVDALDLDKTLFRIGTSKIFFKAGVLAELEERRDATLFDIFSRLQAQARMFSARRHMKKILNRAVAIRTIQKNARIYAELREWPWWQLYTKVLSLTFVLLMVRPLLAATRNDAELHKKEAELLMIKERAERDAKEKEALEGLKMRLEAEKRKIEDALEAERNLAVDKDALLERSKKRELELEEEVAALHGDLDTLDSQLDQGEQREWASREEELLKRLASTDRNQDDLQREHDNLQKEAFELRRQLTQREEDLSRVRERMDAAISELDVKLSSEAQAHDLAKDRANTLEHDVRQARTQLTELARTASDYSDMIKRKDADIARVAGELEASKTERSRLSKEILEHRGRIEALTAEIGSQRDSEARHAIVQEKLQDELDKLRSLIEAKASEESRRGEVEKQKDAELQDLRLQAGQLQNELSEARRTAFEVQNKLKVDLEASVREHNSLLQSHRSLSDRLQANDHKLKQAEASLAEVQKTRDGELAELQKTKESLERQLHAAQAKYQDFEDAALQLERDKNAQDRQVDTLKQQIDAETAKRSQLERIASKQKAELIQLRDKNAKFDRELNKLLTELKTREWEVKQLESRQDKTIVEHVHVLEEAKRVTDRQLVDAQKELESQAAYIRSLEKAKARLTNEAEDLARATEKEHAELRSKEKAVRAKEALAKKAVLEAELERKNREALEGHVRRLQEDLQVTRDQVAEVTQEFHSMQRSKDELEAELARLADETDGTESLARIQPGDPIRESQVTSDTVARIQERIDRQHAEIRRMILADSPQDVGLRDAVLRELQSAEQASKELLSRNPRESSARTLANIHPEKRTSLSTNGVVRPRNEAPSAPSPRKSDAQVAALKQQVQVLELRMAASLRVRQHLEASIQALTLELEEGDGSKQFFEQYKQRLANENGRLSELLEDESEARRHAEAAQLDGVQAMWAKFQNTINAERESYTRLEESRKALVVQQRNAQAEVEDNRRQIQDLNRIRKQLQRELVDVKDRLETELAAKNEEANQRRQVQAHLSELQISLASSSAAQSELREAMEAFRSSQSRTAQSLKPLRSKKSNCSRGSCFTTVDDDTGKAQSTLVAERDAAEDIIRAAEAKIHELEARLEKGAGNLQTWASFGREFGRDGGRAQQYQKDLAERDFTADQTRKKYQAELAQLSEELQSQRDSITKLREELRKARSDNDELSLRYDDEVYNGAAWKKERERLETKIADLSRAYESSIAAQAEQQSQIVALHSQVRELRSVLNDAEADRALLQKARRGLQAELETIKMDTVDVTKINSDRELQTLQLKNQDLERALEETGDRVEMAFERMKKAELHAQECQVELGKVRVENSELDKLNANLEKQLKELNLRIIDLETKSYSRNPQSSSAPTIRRLESRIEELTNQLGQVAKDHRRASLSSDFSAQLVESERQRGKLEEEVRLYDEKVKTMRVQMDDMVTNDGERSATAKRRAEREVTELRQKSLSLDRQELEGAISPDMEVYFAVRAGHMLIMCDVSSNLGGWLFSILEVR